MPRKARALGRAHAVAIVVALGGLIFSVGEDSARRTHPHLAASPARDTIGEHRSDPKSASRPHYPYSVIPGGVEGAAELQNDLARDPVAAAHYAGFVLAKAHVVRLDHDRLAYVSYRIADRIFWTSRKIRLPEGETVITDGTRQARTRCGNRLSDTPEAPISPIEPPQEAFDEPAGPEFVALLAPTPESLPPNSPPQFPPTGGAAPESGPPGGGSGPFIPPAYYPPVDGGTPSSPGHPSSEPPVTVPEPGSLELLAAGTGFLLAANWLVNFRRRRRA